MLDGMHCFENSIRTLESSFSKLTLVLLNKKKFESCSNSNMSRFKGLLHPKEHAEGKKMLRK